MNDNLIYPSSLSFCPDIRPSDFCVEQFRFPKSRKRRIRNKWTKRPENWRPARYAYVMGDTIYMHPQMLAKPKAHPMTVSHSYREDPSS